VQININISILFFRKKWSKEKIITKYGNRNR